ncbi:MAG: hypothetical protein M1828_004361 [Chrysothrix sp. TS-e1954]|nr:MAG: hypothetical protein M1828_004361 [Chrysothrix sp. TS-e1954]
MDQYSAQMAVHQFNMGPIHDPFTTFDLSYQQPQQHMQQQQAPFICPQDVTRSDEDMSACISTVDDAFQRADSSAPANKKKRKSWGQVLPKPTTNLPPRKRAKTEDEKAQRKYERVQRNRHAAHMSRMRKQDEMEQLKHQNDVLKQDNSSLTMENSRLQEELNMFRSGSTVTPCRQSTTPSSVIESLEAPSLTASLSPSTRSIDHDSIETPPPLPAASCNVLPAVDVGLVGLSDDGDDQTGAFHGDMKFQPSSQIDYIGQGFSMADLLDFDRLTESPTTYEAAWDTKQSHMFNSTFDNDAVIPNLLATQ